MAFQTLDLGIAADDGTGDSLRVGGDKINDNFLELYTALGDGDGVSSGISASATVITLVAPIIAEIDNSASITLDAGQDIVLDADGGDIFFKDAGATFGSATNSSGNLIIKSGTTTAATFSGANVTLAGTLGVGAITTTGAFKGADGYTIGNASVADVMTLASTGIVTFKDDILIKDGGTIGVASSTSAITISSGGIVTLVDDLLLKDACTIGTATTAGAISIAADGLVNLATAAATVNSAVIRTAGTDTIWIPAAAMRPTSSNGCAAITDVETTSGRPDMQVLDFDPSSDEHAQFQISMPKSWNEGTITAQFYWTTTATDTDGVSWAIQGVCVSDNDTIDVAYGTAIVVDDSALGAAEDLCVTAATGAITVGGSPAAGDLAFFRVFRDVSDSNDDMGEDARLIGVKIFFTTNAATDA